MSFLRIQWDQVYLVPLGSFIYVIYLKNIKTEIKNNFNQNTALLNACERRNIEGVKVLLEYNANINVQDEFKKTPLILACDANSYDMVKILLEHNADINIQTKSGYTALILAAMHNHINIVKIFHIFEIGSFKTSK